LFLTPLHRGLSTTVGDDDLGGFGAICGWSPFSWSVGGPKSVSARLDLGVFFYTKAPASATNGESVIPWLLCGCSRADRMDGFRRIRIRSDKTHVPFIPCSLSTPSMVVTPFLTV